MKRGFARIFLQNLVIFFYSSDLAPKQAQRLRFHAPGVCPGPPASAAEPDDADGRVVIQPAPGRPSRHIRPGSYDSAGVDAAEGGRRALFQ